MTVPFLPNIINIKHLAKAGAELRGQLASLDFPRVKQLGSQVIAVEQVHFHFAKGDALREVITGEFTVTLQQTCQRCLESYDHVAALSVTLVRAHSDLDAQALPNTVEVWVCEEDNVLIADIIEEEILLNLPLVARHPEASCGATINVEPQDEPEAVKRNNPFSKLKEIY